MLTKPRRYVIAEAESEILETYLKKKWSPETISAVCFDGRICHQTFYNYIERDRQFGGKLHKLLYLCKSRHKRYGVEENRGQICNKISIEERPDIVARKTRFGDWEGDLITGKNHKGAILTLVERKSKYLCAARLSGKNAEETKNNTIQLLRNTTAHTITFDNGKEFAKHEEMRSRLKSDIYFAHPYTSGERGLNEYTNRLLRQYFPKKMYLRKAKQSELKFALKGINERPRKTLNWKSPNECINELSCAAPYEADRDIEHQLKL